MRKRNGKVVNLRIEPILVMSFYIRYEHKLCGFIIKESVHISLVRIIFFNLFKSQIRDSGEEDSLFHFGSSFSFISF